MKENLDGLTASLGPKNNLDIVPCTYMPLCAPVGLYKDSATVPSSLPALLDWGLRANVSKPIRAGVARTGQPEERRLGQTNRRPARLPAPVAAGESAIKGPSPLNALKDTSTYDHS